MTLEADHYRLTLRFEKLFADPRIFDEPENIARTYLKSKGVSPEDTDQIYQNEDEVIPVDDTGRPSTPSGIGKFSLEGKTLRSEFMQGANLKMEYFDFGSGLSPDVHERIWRAGRLEDTSFEVREFNHQREKIELGPVSDLYSMLRARATPTTMATVELTGVSGNLFAATVRYLEDQLKRTTNRDGGSVEVYAARNLNVGERKALEKRIARESTDSTIYVVLSTIPTG